MLQRDKDEYDLLTALTAGILKKSEFLRNLFGRNGYHMTAVYSSLKKRNTNCNTLIIYPFWFMKSAHFISSHWQPHSWRQWLYFIDNYFQNIFLTVEAPLVHFWKHDFIQKCITRNLTCSRNCYHPKIVIPCPSLSSFPSIFHGPEIPVDIQFCALVFSSFSSIT